jgi:outer membrane protein assembly factor BamB
MPSRCLFASIVWLSWLIATTPAKGDWPCFRGPNRTGVTEEKGFPLEWSVTRNVVWKTPLPGPGASSPIVFQDRIYLTCYSGYGVDRASPGMYEGLKRHLVCVSCRDGKIVWDASFRNNAADDRYVDFVNLHGYASSTPAGDESGIYAFFGSNGVRAYSHEGELKWEQSCGDRYTNFGSASSPVLTDDMVIINAAVESQAVIALDKRTGKKIWHAAVSGDSRSTPLLLKRSDSQELVFHLKSVHEGGANEGKLAALDPHTGKPLWECLAIDNYLNPSPVAHEGVIYAIGGSPNRAVAIRAGGRGDITGTHKLWDIKQGSEIGTPVYYEGHLYWANEESGIAYCVEAKTGDVKYKERLQPRPGRIYASGVIGDGKLYYVSRENGTFVLPASPRFELLAHNTFTSDASVFNATPAISTGRLYLRSDKYLYCLSAQ